MIDGSQRVEEPIALPPDLQSLHLAVFGRTGAGKSMWLINGALSNHAATDGADILFLPKGDGMAVDYLRAHYARYGTLENVHYFDCAETLPAFPVLSIERALEAGIPRETAVQDTIDHVMEMLRGIMGRDRFDQAVRSPDIIRQLLWALFDPVHGDDAITYHDLHGAVRRMHEEQSPPRVSDPHLRRMLEGVTENDAQSFTRVMQGVATRIEKIPMSPPVARIFDHVPGADTPSFDLGEHLSEDCVIVFDTGRLRTETQRVLALVVLSELWTALKRRKRTAGGGYGLGGGHDGDLPLVNLYLEEAASLAGTGLLDDLLSQSRSFGCSVMLAMQFPAQLAERDHTAYEELLNEVGTIVTGNVPDDRRLATRLATDDMDPGDVANRLRALKRGEWLVKLPARFFDREPRPFVVESLPLPPGHPDGSAPFDHSTRAEFKKELATARARTRTTAGLQHGRANVIESADRDGSDDAGADHGGTGTEGATDADSTFRVDTALPHTERMPATVCYDESLHALCCTECDNRYDPTADGMERAIDCCSSLDAVDTDDVPICELNLKLTPEERADSEWSDRQLLFLQAVYNAQQLRYGPPAYDLLQDSMVRLQEYVGIDRDAIDDLLEAGVLRHEGDHPHRLYTVTPVGRSVIGESYRETVDFGHGAGDLEESSEHVLAVEVGRRLLVQAHRDDPDSNVERVVPYYEFDDEDDDRRLDVAGLNTDGEVVATVEAERINKDIHYAVPEDYDKMADCDPETAVWLVMRQADAHEVLSVLNDPPDGAGEPRVEKTYAETTPPQQFTIDTPGLTDIYPVEWVRDRLDDQSAL